MVYYVTKEMRKSYVECEKSVNEKLLSSLLEKSGDSELSLSDSNKFSLLCTKTTTTISTIQLKWGEGEK